MRYFVFLLNLSNVQPNLWVFFENPENGWFLPKWKMSHVQEYSRWFDLYVFLRARAFSQPASTQNKFLLSFIGFDFCVCIFSRVLIDGQISLWNIDFSVLMKWKMRNIIMCTMPGSLSTSTYFRISASIIIFLYVTHFISSLLFFFCIFICFPLAFRLGEKRWDSDS